MEITLRLVDFVGFCAFAALVGALFTAVLFSVIVLRARKESEAVEAFKEEFYRQQAQRAKGDATAQAARRKDISPQGLG